MRKIIKEEWEFEGNKYKVGNSLNEDDEQNNIYPIVWFENRLYKAVIKPERKPRISRIGLWDIYDSTKKPFWTTVDKVCQIIKQNN
jgi:hypothetical protein